MNSVQALGRYLKMDPAGVIRDQDGRYVEGARAPGAPMAGGHDERRGGGRGERWPGGGGGGGGGGGYREPYYRDERGGGYDGRPPMGRGGGPGPGSPPHRGGAGRQRAAFQRSGPRPPPSCAEEMEDWKQRECAQLDCTRTLFVGNLPARCDEPFLRKLFGRYGNIEEVDIKSPHEGSDAVYSFIQFENLDQSQEAKYYEDGQVVAGGKRCNIGYGKPVKSRRLFVGGLGPWTSIEALAKEFDRFGAIEKIDYIRGGDHAYALFVSQEAAYEACRKMQGFLLGGPSYPALRCDFSSLPHEEGGPEASPSRSSSRRPGPGSVSSVERRPSERRDSDSRRSARSLGKRSRSRSERSRSRHSHRRSLTPQRSESRSRSPSRDELSGGDERNVSLSPSRSPSPKHGRRGPRTPPDSPPRSPPPPPIFSAQTIEELEKSSEAMWQGPLVLKKSAYPISLWRLRGDEAWVGERLREGGEPVALAVTQRRPFAQSSVEEFRKYLTAPADSAAVLLGTPNPDGARECELPTRQLRDLVKYLLDKAAGGVVSLGGLLVYMFPASELSAALLAELAPDCRVMDAAPQETLLFVLVKTSRK